MMRPVVVARNYCGQLHVGCTDSPHWDRDLTEGVVRYRLPAALTFKIEKERQQGLETQ